MKSLENQFLIAMPSLESDYFTHDGSVTGELLVPDNKRQYLVDALDVQYTIWDEDPGAESLADVRFVRAMDQLLSHVKKEPNAYGLFDFTLNY